MGTKRKISIEVYDPRKRNFRIGAVIIAGLIIAGMLAYSLLKDSSSVAEREEGIEAGDEGAIIKSLTAPSEEEVFVEEEIIKSLTAPPGKDVFVEEEIIRSLTAPEP